MSTYENAARTVIARLPDEADGSPGTLINHGTVNGFFLAWMDQTNDARLNGCRHAFSHPGQA